MQSLVPLGSHAFSTELNLGIITWVNYGGTHEWVRVSTGKLWNSRTAGARRPLETNGFKNIPQCMRRHIRHKLLLALSDCNIVQSQSKLLV